MATLGKSPSNLGRRIAMCGVSDGEKDRLRYPRKEHEIFLEGPRGLCGELELEFDCCFSGVKEEFLGRHCQG